MTMGLLDLISTSNTTAAGPLTVDDLLRLRESMLNAPPHPCRLGQHLISSRCTPGSLTLCSNCGTPIRVPTPWPRVLTAP